MKKILFILVIFLAIGTTFAQEKGLHLTLGGTLGWTNFAYKLDGGNYERKAGGSGYLGAQYFFNSHWGISLAAEFTVYNTRSLYTDTKLFEFKGEVDDEGDNYDLKIRLINWKEEQKTNFMEIPLMGVYQYKFGKKERHGFYMGLGFKVQIPLSTYFKRVEGEVKVSGYYPLWKLYLGEEGFSVELPQHAYGTNENRQWNGKDNLRTGLALTGKFGFLLGLSPRVDLMLGISTDYGLSDMSKKRENLLGPVEGTPQQTGSYVSEQVYYNGILNSNQATRINARSFRGEVGLRIKIGKLKERDELSDLDGQTKKLVEILSNMERGYGKRDTIVVNPVVVPIYLPLPDGEGYGEGGIRPANYEGSYGTTPSSGGAATGGGTIRRGAALPQSVIDELEESIYFSLDGADLDKVAIAVLDRKIAQMKKYPHATVSVVGHTCDLGSGIHNNELSLNRAVAARFYMISKGIKPSRIEVIPMGKHYPTYPNSTEESRRLNRRVDFIFNE